MTSAAGAPEAATLGVEEEFHVLDADSLALTSAAPRLLVLAPGPGLVGELPMSQIEAVTPVCGSLAEVRAEVARLRGIAADAAVAAGLRIASCGTAPLGEWRVNRPSADPSYAQVVAANGHLVREQLIAGLHVHVGVPDPERAVAVLDRTRDWLPVVLALAASSPLWLGADSGFASWRTVHWRRWPVTGPAPEFGSAGAYDAEVTRILRTGIVPGESRIYWDARRSARFPTVEFRVADAVHTVAEAVAIAGLLRALVRTVLADHDAGVPLRGTPDGTLRQAGWLAARSGLHGPLLDPRPRGTGTVPAADAVGALLELVRPALEEYGDRAAVEPVLLAAVARGGGAGRQRAAAAEGGPRAAAALVVRETTAGVPREGLPRIRAGGGDASDPAERRLAAERPPHHA